MSDKIPSNHHTIITEDLNARMGNNPLAGITQRSHESTSNENCDFLIDFCFQNKFRITNTFFDRDF